VKAVQIVQARRFSVNIDDEMKNMLLSFIDVVEAQQMVEAAGSMQHTCDHGISSLVTTSSKRGRDEQMDSVMQEDDDDEARFGGRTFVPFSD
jgi:hypothetical protein